ncbi:major facilitator superfamily domain-containing protein [Fennellomyces sp. T-0311]|nr:major facilitator superfamily domain-containing protein [Fennellomyces sp. T-0311]
MLHGAENAQSSISFVITMCHFIGDMFTPCAHRIILLIGTRMALVTGTLMVSGGFVAAGFATEVWQLYLAIGVCYGVGHSFLYTIITVAIPQWFHDRCSTANGIICGAVSLSGLLLPYLMYSCNSSLGYEWTFRILGFIFLGANAITCVLVKDNPRSATAVGSGQNQKKIPVLEFLKDGNFIIWVAAAIAQLSVAYVPSFFVPSYASHIGLSNQQGSFAILVMSISNLVGRTFSGFLADRLGNLNTSIIFNSAIGLAALTLWMYTYSFPVLMGYAVVAGFFGISYYTLMPSILRLILSPERYRSGFSVFMVLVCPAILGPTLISAIDDHIDAEPFLTHKIFAGVMPIISALIIFLLKYQLSKEFWSKI